METGFLIDSRWRIPPAKGRVEVDALRCTRCGCLELHAGTGYPRLVELFKDANRLTEPEKEA